MVHPYVLAIQDNDDRFQRITCKLMAVTRLNEPSFIAGKYLILVLP